MANPVYVWDEMLPALVKLFLDPWAHPLVGTSRRQSAATVLAMRALRRTQAVDALFKTGYYWECHPLVRAAYEDWLQIAFLFREPGDARCDEYEMEISKHDARIHDAFEDLCGDEAADQVFPAMPAAVAAFVGLPRGQTNPPSFASFADDVGLSKVHRFVYTYLSGRSHPTGRTQELFDDSPTMAVARIPSRDQEEEARLAVWLIWFTARIAVLATHEFGIDSEPFCEQYLSFVDGAAPNLENCVLVRE